MQVSSTGLLAGRSRRMIQDEIKARLRRYFDESGLMIFDIAARHAACGYDLAAGVREAIERIAGNGGDSDWIARLKVRAVAWEARADQLLNDARDDVKRFKRPLSLIDFLGYGDDAVDEMEEAASLIDLFALVASENPPLKRLLLSLADTALGSAQEFVKSIECAATITRADMRDDLDDFLGALERLVALEHRADDEIRALRHQLVVDVKDARAIYVVHQLFRGLGDGDGCLPPCGTGAPWLPYGRGHRMSRRSPAPAKLDVHRIPYDGAAVELPTKEMVGAKAYNLMRMARRGLYRPPGFVLGTAVCQAYLERGPEALSDLDEILKRELEVLGVRVNRRFGDPRRPLLVSVRSGAPVSMPGMMETVLNIGLNGSTLRGLLRLTGNPRLAAVCRRRLVEQYANVVHGVYPTTFDAILAAKLDHEHLTQVEDLDSSALTELAANYEETFQTVAGLPFPSSPADQLRGAVEAVLKSWMGKRAQSYRKLNGISDSIGTATIVQMMVFGNAGPDSGSGVGFTRDPSDGSNALYVDYLTNAQGEDVVAGRRNALGITDLENRAP